MEIKHNKEQKDELLPSTHHHAKPMLVEVDSCPTMKICSKCFESKSIDNYSNYKYKPKKDGSQKIAVRTYCKDCQGEFTKKFFLENENYKKQWRLKNPEKVKSENLKAKPRTDKWRFDNKVTLFVKKRAYREKNKEHILESKRNDNQKSRVLLTDRYIKRLLMRRNGFKRESLIKYPEIVEVKRLHIKMIRLCKTSQN